MNTTLLLNMMMFNLGTACHFVKLNSLNCNGNQLINNWHCSAAKSGNSINKHKSTISREVMTKAGQLVTIQGHGNSKLGIEGKDNCTSHASLALNRQTINIFNHEPLVASFGWSPFLPRARLTGSFITFSVFL